VDRATVTKYGFLYDRTYMLIREDSEASNVKKTKGSMLVGLIPEMALFTTSIELRSEKAEGDITVTFSPPDAEASSIGLPLVPDTAGLDKVQVDLHRSSAAVFDMGPKYNDWFSERFGYKVRLVNVGDAEREVLFPKATAQTSNSSWLSSIPVVGGLLGAVQEPRLKFQDVAPFLVTTRKSGQAVSDLLPEGAEFDMRKTRPNIVVSGQEAWDEDFWAEISIDAQEGEVKIPLQHNCLRCQSLNVDFKTGAYSRDKNIEVLKLLQKDRRVDSTKKYSAVFGRYGFTSAGDVGKELKVGDVVKVSKKNDGHTGFGKFSSYSNCFQPC
jgi:uncharacterized protein YcbX